MRKIIIYDFADNPVECSIPDGEVRYIYVQIVSGDEVIEIAFLDGRERKFDSSKRRIFDCVDGEYVVPGAMMDRWNGFISSVERTGSWDEISMAYERMDWWNNGKF